MNNEPEEAQNSDVVPDDNPRRKSSSGTCLTIGSAAIGFLLGAAIVVLWIYIALSDNPEAEPEIVSATANATREKLPVSVSPGVPPNAGMDSYDSQTAVTGGADSRSEDTGTEDSGVSKTQLSMTRRLANTVSKAVSAVFKKLSGARKIALPLCLTLTGGVAVYYVATATWWGDKFTTPSTHVPSPQAGSGQEPPAVPKHDDEPTNSTPTATDDAAPDGGTRSWASLVWGAPKLSPPVPSEDGQEPPAVPERDREEDPESTISTETGTDVSAPDGEAQPPAKSPLLATLKGYAREIFAGESSASELPAKIPEQVPASDLAISTGTEEPPVTRNALDFLSKHRTTALAVVAAGVVAAGAVTILPKVIKIRQGDLEDPDDSAQTSDDGESLPEASHLRAYPASSESSQAPSESPVRFIFGQNCTACNGSGRIDDFDSDDNNCPFCIGTGRQQSEQERLALERAEQERRQQQPLPDNLEEVGDEKRISESGDVPEQSASGIDPSEDDSKPYECGVCFCRYAETEITRLEACGHYLCTRCMKETIDSNIRNGQWEMTCHHQGDGDAIEKCHHAITRPEVERIASAKELVLYRNKVTELERRNAGAVPCPNPNSIHADGCGNEVWPEEDTRCMQCNTEGVSNCNAMQCNRRQCNVCQYAFCSVCRVVVDSVPRNAEWHEGQTCEVFQVTNAAMLGGNTKQCPGLLANGTSRCPEVIQKNEGCNHMTCATCDHEFCWTCLHPHTRDPIPERNAVGACTGCNSGLCGTERRFVWGWDLRQGGAPAEDNVDERNWELMEEYRLSQRPARQRYGSGHARAFGRRGYDRYAR